MKTITHEESLWRRLNKYIVSFAALFLQFQLFAIYCKYGNIEHVAKNWEYLIYGICAFAYFFNFCKFIRKFESKAVNITLSIITPLLFTVNVIVYNNLLRLAAWRTFTDGKYFDWFLTFLKKDLAYTVGNGEFRYPVVFLILLIPCLAVAIISPRKISHYFHKLTMFLYRKFNEPLHDLEEFKRNTFDAPLYMTHRQDDSFILTTSPCKTHFPKLETKNLIFREYTKDDANDIAEVISNDKDYRIHHPNSSFDTVLNTVTNHFDEKRKDICNAWIASLKNGPAVAVFVFYKSKDHGSVCLDFKWNDRYTSEEYIKEALEAAIASCFSEVNIHKISLECDSKNAERKALFEACNLSYEGEELDGYYHEKYHNILHYCAINELSTRSTTDYTIFECFDGDECEILFEYAENPHSYTKYIVYSDFTFNDEGNYRAFAAQYDDCDEYPMLLPVGDQYIFDILDKILRNRDY